MRVRDDIPTPALLLDLDRFEANLSRMTGFLRERGKAFRPHGKTHKCPEIAHRFAAAGAVGACTARLSEAEVFAAHGVRGLLITTAVVGAPKIARAVALAQQAPDTIFVSESEQNLRDLNGAAAASGVTLNIAVDLYFGRTGINPGAPATDLVRAMMRLPQLRFAGIQAYDGAAAHTTPFDARATRSRASLKAAVDTRRMIEREGIACPMLSAGSTGTYRIDAEIEGVTEIQPGSFAFMDQEYAGIGSPDGSPEYNDFAQALTVVATVISRRPGVAIVDAGYKAFATDRPFPPAPLALPGVTYAWAGDEHGRLDLTHADVEVRVGDRVEFVPPHCDPTVNLYDVVHALRGNKIEAVWTIAARGRSQ